MFRLVGVLVALGALASFAQQYQFSDQLRPPGSPQWPAIPAKPFELAAGMSTAPVVRKVVVESVPGVLAPAAAHLRAGVLSGKTVYVSAGHGFYMDTALNRWATQRPNTNGIVEDLVAEETMSQYLIPMLQ